MTEIDLRQLTTMVAIAEEGTFTRAADRLGYAQASVSKQIGALERALGGSVFDRPGGPRPVQITPLGAVVLEHGRELLSKADALGDAVERFKAGDGRIDIGTMQSVSNVILPAVIRRLKQEHPNCEIRLSESGTGRARRSATSTCCSTTDRPARTRNTSCCSKTPTSWWRVPESFRPARYPRRSWTARRRWPGRRRVTSPEWSRPSRTPAPSCASSSAQPETKPSCRWCAPGSGSPSCPGWRFTTSCAASCGAIHGYHDASDQPLHVHQLDPTPTRDIYLHWPRGHAGQSPLAARAIAIAVEVARELADQMPSARA